MKPVKRKKTAENGSELRSMNSEDIERAAEWERSPERKALMERNRAIDDHLSSISASYSNRC